MGDKPIALLIAEMVPCKACASTGFVLGNKDERDRTRCPVCGGVGKVKPPKHQAPGHRAPDECPQGERRP